MLNSIDKQIFGYVAKNSDGTVTFFSEQPSKYVADNGDIFWSDPSFESVQCDFNPLIDPATLSDQRIYAASISVRFSYEDETPEA